MLQLHCLLQSFLINNTVNCSSEFFFEGGDIPRLFKPIAWEELRGFIQLPPHFLEEHVLMLWLSILVSSLFLSSLFLMEGMKPPLYRWQGSLFQWVGAFHVREVDRCCHSSWHREYLLISLPPLLCLALPTMTQFHEWLHSSGCSLSTSTNGHWHHSLCLMYMFLPRSAATSCYLRSSSILGGCSGRCPWQKLQLPIFPPQGSFTGRSLGDPLPLFSCDILFLSPLTEVVLHGSDWYTCPCMMAAHTQGNTNLWHDKKKSVSVEDLWPPMLVHHFIRGDVCCDLMHHLPSLFFPPILDLPLSLKSIHFH